MIHDFNKLVEYAEMMSILLQEYFLIVYEKAFNIITKAENESNEEIAFKKGGEREEERERERCYELQFHEGDELINEPWIDGDLNQAQGVLLPLDTLNEVIK